MNIDIRLPLGVLRHPKVTKLKRYLGADGVLSLITLWIFTAEYKPAGILSDMDVYDIELYADWNGEEGQFVNFLLKLKLLDEDDGVYSIHDWEEWQDYATKSEERSEIARRAANARWEQKKADANFGQDSDKNAPKKNGKKNTENAKKSDSRKTANASAMHGACPEHANSMPEAYTQQCNGHADSNAPKPSPLPEPELKKQNSLSPESINLKPRVYTREEQQGERDFSFSENPVPGELPEQEQPVTGETLPEDFVRLRKFYSENCHLEDEKAGLKDFMRLQSLGKWPGIDAVLNDLQRIMATGEYHKGFWPSLWQYLASLAGFLLPTRPTASTEQNVQPASQEPETPETPLPDRISYQGDEGNGQAVLLSAAIDSTFNGIADRQGYSFPQNQHSSQNKPTPKARDKPDQRPASLDEPIAEFQELRDFYTQNCRAEGPLAGFREYKDLKASHKWPGANRIFDDWDKRLKANHYDKGYWPALARYFGERTWEGPIIPRKPENNGALPERPF